MSIFTRLGLVCRWKQGKESSQPLIMPFPSSLSDAEVISLLSDIEAIDKPRNTVVFSDIVGSTSNRGNKYRGDSFRQVQKRCSALTKLDIDKYVKYLEHYGVKPSKRTLAEQNGGQPLAPEQEVFASDEIFAALDDEDDKFDSVEADDQDIDDFALIGGLENLSVGTSTSKVQGKKHGKEEGQVTIHLPPSKKTQFRSPSPATPLTPPRAVASSTNALFILSA